MSRIFMLVPAAKPGEKDKKKRAKMKMGETLWLAPVNHITSSYPAEADPPPIVDPDVLAAQEKEKAAAAAAAKEKGGKKDPKAPSGKEEMRKKMEEEEKKKLEETQTKRKHSREPWSHDAITIAHFFPAFTLGGRQPYAMFTRPNGDIVRASPVLRPNVVTADGATVGESLFLFPISVYLHTGNSSDVVFFKCSQASPRLARMPGRLTCSAAPWRTAAVTRSPTSAPRRRLGKARWMRFSPSNPPNPSQSPTTTTRRNDGGTFI
jgi:hypothetical protein